MGRHATLRANRRVLRLAIKDGKLTVAVANDIHRTVKGRTVDDPVREHVEGKERTARAEKRETASARLERRRVNRKAKRNR